MGTSTGRAVGDARPLVWIVDDSPTHAAFAEHALGEAYRYERFLSGETVIERISSGSTRPDLIVLDWVMPGLSGDEVCRYLRQIPEGRDVAIVIITASRTEIDDIVCAIDSGANDYVAKPFAPAELQARVGSLLRASQLKAQALQEGRRLAAMNELANALLSARNDVQGVLDAVALWMVYHLADGCGLFVKTDRSADVAVKHLPAEAAPMLGSLASCATGHLTFSDSDDARSRLPKDFEPYIEAHGVRAVAVRRFEISDLGHWTVVLVRGAHAAPFDAADMLAVETALDYSRLAIESALRSQNERSTARFHQEMLGIVSHDLRTPLTAFLLGMELLASDALAPHENAQVRGRLERSAKRMAGIVEQLLDVTRARIGTGIPMAFSRASLRAIVDRVVDELGMANTTNAAFLVAGDDVEGDWDASRLEQVIANLAGNAARYGRLDAPIRINMTSTPEHAHVTVHNENRGAPIEADMLDTFFDPFRRGNTSGNPDGLGLGLYISAEIVKAHNGTLVVASDETGTSFRMSLPRVNR